jgi:hypothetical protein
MPAALLIVAPSPTESLRQGRWPGELHKRRISDSFKKEETENPQQGEKPPNETTPIGKTNKNN